MKKYFTISLLLFSFCAFAQNLQYSIKKHTALIDANFEEWDSIKNSSLFVNHQTGDTSLNSTIFKSTYDSTAVYFYFEVKDQKVITTNNAKRDDQIFNTDDCVELFIDFDGDGKNYLEIGINPNGVFYDYHIVCPHSVCGYWENDASLNLKNTAVKSFQTANGYKLEIAISYRDLSYYKSYGFTKPNPASIWRANFYNINKPIQQLNSWSVIGQYGFHHPTQFGVLTFE